MSARIEVRRAEYDDPVHRAGIVDIVDSYAGDPVGGGKPLAERARADLVAALRDHPASRVFLAFADGAPVGVAICFEGLSTFRAEPLLNIHDLAVLPDWRGGGIGRALLTAVEEWARAAGCCKLTLEVQDDNARARGLYESFGFADFVVGGPAPTRFLTKPLDD